MSNTKPTHNQTTTVEVTTQPGAQVSATAHYKTTSTTHGGVADGTGHAAVPFDISTATVGYTVGVDVSVTDDGGTGHCVTSFTPTAASTVPTVKTTPVQPVAPVPVNNTPADATALCNDGTLSYAAHHQGACSHHGGVAVFYH